MTQEKHEISELLTLLAATEYLYKQGTADHVPPEKRYYHPEGRHTGPRGGRFSIIGVETDPDGNPLGQLVPTLAPGMENESVRAWIEKDPEAQHVLNTLSQYGNPYVVGGGVRDSLLGIPSKDVDIEVYGLTIDELSDIVQKDFGGKQDQVGKVYGVFKVGNFDISLPRTETKVGDKHTDFDVAPNPDLPPELAARRRDFTINALMYDYKNDQVLDFFGGIQDLEAKRIKHVSPETFVEDPLRVYRAAQFAARFDFSIDPSTIELARSMDLSEISNERVFGEFEKLLLKSSTPSTGIQALDDMEVLDAQFPEISALKNTHQRSDFHAEGDVFTHTKMTLDKASEIIQRFPDQKDKTIIMLAALCHDLGKATTTTPDGRAIGHEAAGVPITEEFLSKLTNDKDILTTVPSLVENHLRPLQFHRDGASDAAFRRLINKHGTEYLNLLSAVSEADVSGRLVGYPDGSVGEPGTEENVWFRDKVKQVAEKAGGLKGGKIAPLITGKDLKNLGLKEGKELGSILRDVQKRQEEGEITSADEALDYVKNKYQLQQAEELPATSITDLPVYEGEAYRVEDSSEFRGGGISRQKGSAADVVRWEQDEMGNDLGISDEIISQLEDVPASDLLWVGRTKDDVFWYSDVSKELQTDDMEEAREILAGQGRDLDEELQIDDVTDEVAGGRVLNEESDGALVFRGKLLDTEHLSKQEVTPSQEWTTGFVPPEKRFYHLGGTHKGPRGGQFSIIGTEVDQHGASLQQAAQAQPPGPHDISELPMSALQPVEQFHGDVPETGKSITLTLHHGKREMGKGADERGYATDAGDLGRGIYYSTDEGTAKGYGEVSSQELTFKNPLAVSARDIANPEQTGLAQKYKTIVSMHPGVSAEEKKRLALEGSTKLTEDLLEQGYDALIVSGYDSPKGHYTVVDLKPSDQPQQAEEIGDEQKYWDRVTEIAEKSGQSTEAIRSFLDDPGRREEILTADLEDPFTFAGIQLQVALADPKSPESKQMSQIEEYLHSKLDKEDLERIYSHRMNKNPVSQPVFRSVFESLISSRYPNNDNVSIPMGHIKTMHSINLQNNIGANDRLKEYINLGKEGELGLCEVRMSDVFRGGEPPKILLTSNVSLFDVESRSRNEGQGFAQTVVHELAHAVHFNMPEGISRKVSSLYLESIEAKSGFPSLYSITDQNEFFAECYSSYIVDTQAFRDRNPSMAKLFDEEIFAKNRNELKAYEFEGSDPDTAKVVVAFSGDTDLAVGGVYTVSEFEELSNAARKKYKRQVQIRSGGDTLLGWDDVVTISEFEEINEEIVREGGNPAIAYKQKKMKEPWVEEHVDLPTEEDLMALYEELQAEAGEQGKQKIEWHPKPDYDNKWIEIPFNEELHQRNPGWDPVEKTKKKSSKDLVFRVKTIVDPKGSIKGFDENLSNAESVTESLAKQGGSFDLPELLTLLASTEYLYKQGGNQGTPAPSEGTPEHAHRGKNWDYVSSTPAPEGARTLHTASGKAWWQAGGGEGEQPQQAEEGGKDLQIHVKDDPKIYGEKQFELRQPSGAAIRGIPISPTDAKIPDEVYHVTTNASAVRSSGFLRASGAGGLGGDRSDQIVSFTIDKNTAIQLKKDFRLMAEVSRLDTTKEMTDRLAEALESEGWGSSTLKRFKETTEMEHLQDRSAKEWLAEYFQPRWRADSHLKHPVVFSSVDEMKAIDLKNIDIISVPKSSLKTGALLTDFDLDSPGGLKEIRSHGDVPLSADHQSQQAEEKTPPPPEFKEFFEADTGKIDKNPELVKKLAEVIAQDREQTLGSEHIESVKEPVVGWIEGRFEMIQGVRAVIAQMRGEEIDKEAIREVLLTSGAKLGLTKAVVTDEYIEGQIDRGLDEIGEYDNPGATAKLLEAEQKYAEKRTRELFGDTITVYRAFRGSEVRGMADRIKSGETVEMNLLPGTSYSMGEGAAVTFSIFQHPGTDHMVWKQEVDAADVLFAWYSNPSFLTGHAHAQPYQKEVVINPKNTSITLTKDDFVALPEEEMSEEEKRQKRVKLLEMQERRDSIADKDEAIKELAPDQYKLWLEQGTFTAEGKRLSGFILDSWQDVEGRAEHPDQYEDEDDDDENDAYYRVWDAFPELANMDDWDRMWKKLDELGMKEFGDMSPEDKKERGLE